MSCTFRTLPARLARALAARAASGLLPALCFVAQAESDPLALERLDWSAKSPVGSAFPAWISGPGTPSLLASARTGDEARLVLWDPLAPTERTLAAGQDWLLNWADVPAAARLADGTLAWTWLALDDAHEHSYGTRFQLARAGLERASEPRPLEEHRGPGEHGFVSLAPLASESGFLALWLDGRATSEPGGETRVYARTLGAAGELGPEQLVDGRACSCCPTSLVRLAGGAHLAAWRDRSAREVRDIALARFDGKEWTAPELLHADGWEIDGCPVNGPRLAAGPAAVAATWYTGAAGGAVRVAFGDAEGQRFEAPIGVDEGMPVGRGDAVFLADGSLLVGWMEHGRELSAWSLRRVTRDGRLGPVLVLAEVSAERSSGFLRLAADAGGALAAYTETSPERRVVLRRVRAAR